MIELPHSWFVTDDKVTIGNFDFKEFRGIRIQNGYEPHAKALYGGFNLDRTDEEISEMFRKEIEKNVEP